MSKHPIARPPVSARLRRRLFFVSFAVAFVLVACNTSDRLLPQLLEPDGEALFSDSQLDSAPMAVLGSLSVLTALEAEARPAGAEITLAEPVVSSASLANRRGYVTFIRQNPPERWLLLVYDHQTDTLSRAYAGRREIQSVAISGDGDTLLFSMRQNIDATSPFQIWRYSISRNELERLTDTQTDNTHVGLTADAQVITWEGSGNSGRRGTFIQDSSGSLNFLGSNFNETQPAISGGGQYLTFLRQLTPDRQAVMRYDRSAGLNTEIHRVGPNSTLRYPSVSNRGDVAWLAMPASGRYLIRMQHHDSNDTFTLISSVNPITHPFLTSDAASLAYGFTNNQRSIVRFMDLTTSPATFMNVLPAVLPNRNSGMMWQLPVTSASYRLRLYPSGISASSTAGNIRMTGLPLEGHTIRFNTPFD